MSALLNRIDLDELRRRTPLVRLIGQQVTLKRAGTLWKGCCPFHAERSPSFTVYPRHFHCFGCGAHGDAIAYVRRAEGLDFRAAIERLAAEAGLAMPASRRQQVIPKSNPELAGRAAPRQAKAEREEASRTRYAGRLWGEAASIAGTPAELHLTAVRHIPRPSHGWPASVRWHPRRRALIVAATTAAGDVPFAQLVPLDVEGRPDAKAALAKRSHGVQGGLPVRYPGDPARPLLLAEGAATGMAGWAAMRDCETWCALGNLWKLQVPRARLVILLADDDAPGKSAKLEDWAAQLRADGYRVALVYPFAERRFDGADFADLQLEAGAEAVRGRIRAAILAEQGFAIVPAPFALPVATPAEVRGKIVGAVNGFFAARALQPPSRLVLPGPTGAGKTQAVGELLPHVIAADRADERPHRGVLALPSHRLSRQVAQRYLPHGVKVEVLEGRGDPWKQPPPGRSYLCQNLEAVGLALNAGQDVGRTVCGKPGKSACRFRAGCAYYAQFPRVRDAEVVAVAHPRLFEKLPKSLLQGVGWIVADEDFTGHADAIFELSAETFSRAALDAFPVLLKNGEVDPVSTGKLAEIHALIAAFIEATSDGFWSNDAASAAGLTKQLMGYARKLNWRRRRPVKMHPTMSLEDRREAARAAPINAQLPRVATFLRTLGKGEAGRIRVYLDSSRSGPRRKLVVHGRRQLAEWAGKLPLLWMSATARAEDARDVLPGAHVVAVPAPALPHQQVHQVLGAFGKSGLANEAKLAELVDDVKLKALGKTALVITHQQHKAAFANIPGVRVMHLGDVAGDDDHGDVDVVFQVGGSFARKETVAELATARSGRPVPIAPPVRTPCVALMADGTGIQFERMAYADADAQRVHEGIYDQSFVQGGLGRGRGINRTTRNPLRIYLYGNVPLPTPVASIERWQTAAPDRLARMVARRRVCFNAADMRGLHPELFKTMKAAEHARARFLEGEPMGEAKRRLLARLRGIVGEDAKPWSQVTWQPSGQGQRLRLSYCPSDEVDAMRIEIEAVYGELVSWSVETFTQGRGEDIPAPGKEPFQRLGTSSAGSPPEMRPMAALERDAPGDRPQGRPPDG